MTEKSQEKSCGFFSNPSEDCELTGELCERAHTKGVIPVNDPCHIFELWRKHSKNLEVEVS